MKLRIFLSVLIFLCGISVAHAQTVSIPPGSSASNNWAGYIADNGFYNDISGSWIVPTVAPSIPTEADATWIGIGGQSSPDLIQAGTYAIAVNGQTEYQAWYELLPNATIPINFPINAGDSVSASILEVGANVWQISLYNKTTGGTWSITVPYVSSHSSAEWIEERPILNVDVSSLDDFGSITFTDLSTIKNGYVLSPQAAGAQPIAMVQNDTVVAVPSVIATTLQNQETFVVSRTDEPLTETIVPQRQYIFPNGTTVIRVRF